MCADNRKMYCSIVFFNYMYCTCIYRIMTDIITIITVSLIGCDTSDNVCQHSNPMLLF